MIKASIVDDDRILLDADFHHYEKIKQLMGTKWDKVREKWTVPLTWTSCIALYNDFGDDFKADAALDAWGFEQRDNLIGPAVALRSRLDLDGLDRTKTDVSTTIAGEALDLADKSGLYPHQAAGTAFIAVTKSNMILDQQGTGKTPQLISALRLMYQQKHPVFPVLVVSPATVKTHWERDFNKWYPGLTVINVRGSAEQRRKQLSTPAHVYIISYGSIAKHTKLQAVPGAPAMKRCPDCKGFDPKVTEKNCQAHTRELNKIPFKTVVVDEAHRALNPKSVQTRAIWAVSDEAVNRISMTGTPVQDNIADLYGLLRFVAPKEFPGKTGFLQRYAIVGRNPWGAFEIQGLNPLRTDELDSIIARFSRRMLKKVVLPFLPPMVEEIRTVEMTGAQAKAYRDMKKTAMMELTGKTVATTSPLIKATRLLQLSSSFLELKDPLWVPDPEKDDDSPGMKLAMPSNKITAFMEDIAAGDYDTAAAVIVFAQSKQLLEMLSAEMTAKGIEHGKVVGGMSDKARDADIDAFQAGKMRYILVSVAAGGAGLTLTAADTEVFIQRSYSSTQMDQAYARAHRIGSEIHESIRIVHYISEGTIEGLQIEDLQSKNVRIQAILKDETALLEWLKESETK